MTIKQTLFLFAGLGACVGVLFTLVVSYLVTL